jgi:hypothetical protein
MLRASFLALRIELCNSVYRFVYFLTDAIDIVCIASGVYEMQTHWLSSSPFDQCVCIRNTLALHSFLRVATSVAATKRECRRHALSIQRHQKALA